MWLSFCVHGFTYVLFEMILEVSRVSDLEWIIMEWEYVYVYLFQ